MQHSFIRRRAGVPSVRLALACGIAGWALASTQAMAQVPAAEEDMGAIVVTGTRPIAESEAAALEIQKNWDSLVTVAASDSVGRLPDQNIAQAASRLPGISVERDQGQARYINLRGAPKTWTTLSFDGINVVSPEGRDARFDSIPSAIAGKIIVSKAVTPDMPGETVAGNVNVITRSAFDYDGFHLAGKGGLGFAELGDKKEYEGALVVSDRFQTGIGEIGVLLSGSYYERNMVTDNFETDYERVSQDQRPGNATRFWAHEAENKLYRLTRKNWSVSGRVDWKPDEANSISLRSVYTIFTDDEARDNYRFDLDDRQSDLSNGSAACPTAVNTTPTTTGYADVCIGNTPQKGTIYGIDIRQRSTLRAFRQSIFTNTLAGDHEFADGWKLSWVGNYTESKDDRSIVGEATWDSPSTRTLRPTVAYDFSDPNLSRLTLYRTLQLASPTRYTAGAQVTAVDDFTKPLSGFTVLDAVDTTKAYTGRLVVARELEHATLKAGFQYDRRTKTADEQQITLNAAQAATVLPTDYNQFSIDQKFLGKIPMGYTFRYFDTDKMRAASEAAQAAYAFAPNTGNNYRVREEVLAGFLMGTVHYDWGSVVGGVRVEHVKNHGFAIATVTPVSGPAVSTPETRESSQTLAFPSLHINYNIDDSKKLRFSFNSGAARADYDQMRPNFVVNDSDRVISGGNPDVKPERAYGVDTYFEWYVKPQGYLMVGLFYKHVEDVLYNQRRTYGLTDLNSGGIDRSDYGYTRIANGGSGRIYGMEAAAQFQLEPWTENLGLPSFMGGFGISANLTLNDSKVEKPAVEGIPARKVRLPGTSDFVYNIGGYYEKYGLSIRLQYQNRSKWLDTVSDTLADAGDTYWDSDDELDFSARYAITKNFEIYFDASNLLNHPGRRFSDPGSLLRASGVQAPDSSNQTIEWERFGRRYTGGIRFNF
ncbi:MULTISPECIES: TonB-dependent receptor [Sphingobium]|uniref:TonB-dependent receptor n=1 Tax=Sphingobium fuliginis (strain ATCC 27551) TaxID=336203 RepID=A0ABQ1ETG7_SPHSA|nr:MULTISPECIES: TonB-dependent receptor [Sphingobium]RYL99710.1 TonB-dependent receptor [Sphingobium fuliginis]WDA36528.1 TonB-dependent receptor [Sphingobium sp. YC-XJ3]GFZ86653.1 TonB-dependent receptor [Sphingobium fuliginis]